MTPESHLSVFGERPDWRPRATIRFSCQIFRLQNTTPASIAGPGERNAGTGLRINSIHSSPSIRRTRSASDSTLPSSSTGRFAPSTMRVRTFPHACGFPRRWGGVQETDLDGACQHIRIKQRILGLDPCQAGGWHPRSPWCPRRECRGDAVLLGPRSCPGCRAARD